MGSSEIWDEYHKCCIWNAIFNAARVVFITAGILLIIIQLADIRIHIFTNTDNWSNVYISHEFDKMFI